MDNLELLILAVFCALVILFAILLGMFVASLILHLKIRIMHLEPNTEIQFSEEEIEGHDYTVYTHPSHSIFRGDFTTYIVVLPHRISRKSREAIAKKQPYKDGYLVFYQGPKWLLYANAYDRGSEEVNYAHSV